MLAILGGSGLARLPELENARREVVRTPYGEPSGALTFGSIAGHPVVFLARHGYGQTIPAHAVNYRANLWALHAQGVQDVVAIASVGGIRPDFTPGALAVPHQIVDYTHGRADTFFTGADGGVRHIDFTQPYCERLRAACLKAGRDAGEALIDGGVYAAAQGPRLETAAEIDRLERDGADMVGMTGMPEAALARELNLCYAAIAVVANHAAGRGGSRNGINVSEVGAVLEAAMARVRAVLARLVISYGS